MTHESVRGCSLNNRAMHFSKVLARKVALLCELFGLKLKRRNWGKFFAGRAIIDAIFYPADVYKVVTQYRNSFGRSPHLLRPQTFNEWLQMSKLTKRYDRYTQFADKLAVRNFVRMRVGEDILTQIYWIGTDLAGAQHTSLPKKFVIKANHGSGMNLIVADPNAFNWQEAQKLTSEWLNTDYSISAAEWQYRWIQPKIFIEEYLEDYNGNVPIDYKLFCFFGRVELIQVDLNRFTKHTRALVSREFAVLPFEYVYSNPKDNVPKPECLEQMIKIAEMLSKNEPFVRVDMYDAGRPIFGELTLHPEAGLGKFIPSKWDQQLFDYVRMRDM